MKILISLLLLLQGCKFSESSDGKRIIAVGKSLAEQLAAEELKILLEDAQK